jgi:hypothetical protein
VRAQVRPIEPLLRRHDHRLGVRQAFPSWMRPILTEIYLWRTCSCHEIMRMETPGQVALGSEPFDHAQNQNQRNMLVCNAFMISTKGHPFWHAVFRALIEKAEWLKTCRESNRCPLRHFRIRTEAVTEIPLQFYTFQLRF